MGVLRQWFGPSREEIWRELARQVGGEFVEGGFWKGSKVTAKVGEWTVTLDVFVVHAGNAHIPITRLRAPFVNPEGFRFSIHRQGFFSGIAKFFGMQDIEVGHLPFDDTFVVKGNDESRLRLLFGDYRLRQALEHHPEAGVEICDDEGWFGPDFPEGVDELRLQIVGIIRDLDRLRSVYDLFAAVLQRLCAIGAAYEKDPGVSL